MQGQHHFQPQTAVCFNLESFIPAHHLLRKMDKHIDFSFIKTLAAPYYCQEKGRPSVDPEVFFRITIVGYLYDIASDRQLCEELQYNLAYRWFCKLSLTDKIPDHSSLTRIRDRLGSEVFQAFFDSILAQCKNKGLVKGERLLTDSTLIAANAALDSLQALDPALAEQEQQTKKQHQPGLTAPPARKMSNKTHKSRTDPDASLAFKEGTPRGLKYKIHVTLDADSRVILAAKTTTGACHDSQPYLIQLADIEQRYGLKIKETTADRAYGSAEIIEALLAQGIHPYIPLFSTRSGSFVIQETQGISFEVEHNRYRCQAGHYLYPYNKSYAGSMMYHSKTKDCKDCVLSKHCQARRKQNKFIRYVIRNIHQALFETVKQEMTTLNFLNHLSERMWKAEGIMFEAKHCHGLKRAKYRSLTKVQIQTWMTASVQNMKRLITAYLQIIVWLYSHYSFYAE
jgi:transposase